MKTQKFFSLLTLVAAAHEAGISSEGVITSTLQSPPVEDDPIQLMLINASPLTMELWWDRLHGLKAPENRVHVGTLLSGSHMDMKTFPGHTIDWVHPGNGHVARRVHVFHGLHVSEFTGKEMAAEGLVAPAKVGEGVPCIDKYGEFCQQEAQRGECDVNPGWMTTFCAKSCRRCHLTDPAVRCARRTLNVTEDAMAWSPTAGGAEVTGLAHMFESMRERVSRRYPAVGVETLSPTPFLPDGPPILLFENFLSSSEVDAILGTVTQFERSMDTGVMNATTGIADGVTSDSRTSSNAWCRERCEEDPRVMRVIARIEEFVGISRSHFESFQVLKYEPGQYYATHHDMGPSQLQQAAGPRILTFFLYLSDVTEGGGTSFPSLEPTISPMTSDTHARGPPLKVVPRKGSAILWPSVLDENLRQQDPRTHHEALPVMRGTKLAANTWIHLYDFRMPHHWGCTGAFDRLD